MCGENHLHAPAHTRRSRGPGAAGARGCRGSRGDGLGDVLERASRARRSQRALVRRIERQILCRRPAPAPEAETPAPPHHARSWRGPDPSFPVRRRRRAGDGSVPNGTPPRNPTPAPQRRVSSRFYSPDGARRSRQGYDRPVRSSKPDKAPGKDTPSIVDSSCQAPALSTVRTIKYPETTDHMRSPCACNATAGHYHDDGDKNRRLDKIRRIALSEVGRLSRGQEQRVTASGNNQEIGTTDTGDNGVPTRHCRDHSTMLQYGARIASHGLEADPG